jgi:hypothetical protein
MKNLEKYIPMGFEDALKDTSMVHLHEAILFVQNKPNSVLLPKKHEKSMTNLAISDTMKFFHQNPNMPLTKVVATIIQSFPDDVSPSIIVKMTKKIVEKWESLSSFHHSNPNVIAA